MANHTYIGETSRGARDDFHRYYCNYWSQALGAPHPLSRVSRSEFDRMTGPDTTLMVGSSQEVVDKLLVQHALVGNDRFLAQLDIGAQPFKQVARAIERLATEVAPQVRAATAFAATPTVLNVRSGHVQYAAV